MADGHADKILAKAQSDLENQRNRMSGEIDKLKAAIDGKKDERTKLEAQIAEIAAARTKLGSDR